MKDRFSKQAADYAAYRPRYPQSVLDRIYTRVQSWDRALDCGTGNGQVAAALASRFGHVDATDISSRQLSHAVQLPNVSYHETKAEQLPFEDAVFDLITVAQAMHWFDFEAFFDEIRRIAKPHAVFAAFGYGFMHINGGVDDVTRWFYNDVTHDYWDPERWHVDAEYRTIPLPDWQFAFETFDIYVNWDFDTLLGFFGTGSVVKKMEAIGLDPMGQLKQRLLEVARPGERFDIRFPGFMHVATHIR